MTAPLTLPAAPPRTPRLLLAVVALALAGVGPALAFVDPSGKINTAAAQAAVIVAFLVVAFLLYAVHVLVDAIRQHGFDKAAFVAAGTAEISEAKSMWAEIKPELVTAEPLLAKIPDSAGIADRLTAFEQRIVDVEAKVNAVPAAQRSLLLKALRDLESSGGDTPDPATATPAQSAPLATAAAAPASTAIAPPVAE